MGYLRRIFSADQRSTYIKWVIFGVALPLLPFAARALAAWVDGASRSLSFGALFGDGELLVVSTVISAAVIGDLLFDFTGHDLARGRIRGAVLCAFSLVVVVASVLMFGLATLSNQQRTDAVQLAQHEEVSRANQASQLLAASIQEQRQVSNLSAQANYFNKQAKAVHAKAVKEALGIGATRFTGKGPIYDLLRAQALFLKSQAKTLTTRANKLAGEATKARQQGDRVIVTSIANLARGESQTADISIIMFVLSLLTGVAALLLPIYKPTDEECSNKANASPSMTGHNDQRKPQKVANAEPTKG